MTVCPSCGKDIREDIWVCGYCGELVAQAGTADGGAYPGASVAPTSAYSTAAPSGGFSSDYGPGAPPAVPGTPPPLASGRARKSSGSRAVVLASVFGVVAVVAIVAVWFFVLRGGGGGDFSAYLGDWQLTVPGSTTGLSLTIQEGDSAPEMMMGTVGSYAGQTSSQAAGPFKMKLEDGNLVTSLEAADSASEAQKAASEAARAALGAVVDDFKMVFAPGGTPDTLSLTMEGDIQGSGLFGGSINSQAVILTRGSGSTSQTAY
jgi:hypothetical protein